MLIGILTVALFMIEVEMSSYTAGVKVQISIIALRMVHGKCLPLEGTNLNG